MRQQNIEQFVKYASDRLTQIAERTASVGLTKQGAGLTGALASSMGKGVRSWVADVAAGPFGTSGLMKGMGKMMGGAGRVTTYVDELGNIQHAIAPRVTDGLSGAFATAGEKLYKWGDMLDGKVRQWRQAYKQSVDDLFGNRNIDDDIAHLGKEYKFDPKSAHGQALRAYMKARTTGTAAEEALASSKLDDLFNTADNQGIADSVRQYLESGLGRNSSKGKWWRMGAVAPVAIGVPGAYMAWSAGDHDNAATKALALPGNIMEAQFKYTTPLGLTSTAVTGLQNYHTNMLAETAKDSARISSKLIMEQLANQPRMAYLYAMMNPRGFANQVDARVQALIEMLARQQQLA